MDRKIPKKYTIVLADDDEDDIEIIREIFDNHSDFKILATLSNGKELIDFMETSTTKPDVILTDIYMPIMTGIEAVEILVNGYKLSDINIVIMSTLAIPEAIVKFEQRVKIDFFEKPIAFKDFEQMPEKVLNLLQNNRLNPIS